MIGRIDVHSHLLPGVDDGCKSLDESLACAKTLVENGYTHCFCTPHIWQNYPNNSVERIPVMTDALQQELDSRGIALKLIPGGEINIRPNLLKTEPAEVVSYAMQREYALVDIWIDKLEEYFTANIRWLQSLGLTVILAHPERMRLVQDDPAIVDYFVELGLLLQGNLQCFADPLHTHTRRTAELLICQDRYFLLGSDLHGPDTIDHRMRGLGRVAELVGESKLQTLTSDNPRALLPPSDRQ